MIAVAKKTKLVAQRDFLCSKSFQGLVCLRSRQPVKNSSRWASHQALAGPFDDRFLKCFGRKCKQQHACAGAAVERFCGIDPAFKASFGITGDDRTAVAADFVDRGRQPAAVDGGDDQTRESHAERFGERVFDEGRFNLQNECSILGDFAADGFAVISLG